MANLPLNHPSDAPPESSLPPRPSRCSNSYCCPGYRRQRPWTGERIAQFASNLFVFTGTLTALIFAIMAVLKEEIEDYLILMIFIVGGTLFGGGCLLALVNVSWLSRRPGVRVSAIQLICNVVLVLITSYLELLFWPYPTVAYVLLFTAGFPMLIMINLPSCFVKRHPDFMEGGTVCLDQDAMDDATIVDEDDLEKNNPKKLPHSDTQRTMACHEGESALDLSALQEDQA